MKRFIFVMTVVIATGLFLGHAYITDKNSSLQKQYIQSVNQKTDVPPKLLSLHFYLSYIQKLLEEKRGHISPGFFSLYEDMILNADVNLYNCSYENMDHEVYEELKAYLLSLRQNRAENIREIKVLLKKLFENNDAVQSSFTAEQDIFFLKKYLSERFNQKFVVKDMYSEDNVEFMEDFTASSMLIMKSLEGKYDEFMSTAIKASIIANLSQTGKNDLIISAKDFVNEKVFAYELMGAADERSFEELLAFNYKSDREKFTLFVPVFESRDYPRIIKNIFSAEAQNQ